MKWPRDTFSAKDEGSARDLNAPQLPLLWIGMATFGAFLLLITLLSKARHLRRRLSAVSQFSQVMILTLTSGLGLLFLLGGLVGAVVEILGAEPGLGLLAGVLAGLALTVAANGKLMGYWSRMVGNGSSGLQLGPR